MHSNLYKFILAMGVLATCFGQGSYTSSPLKVPYDVANLLWMSDDAKSAFGFGGNRDSTSIQCFTYQVGAVTVIATPGYSCQMMAANAGVAVLQLFPPGLGANFKVVLYTSASSKLLTPPDGVTFHDSTTVNKKGQVAGTFVCPAAPGSSQYFPLGTVLCGYVVSSDGVFTRLPDLGGISGATAINDSGDVVGYVVAPGDDVLGHRHAVIWPHTGGMKDLSDLTSMKLGTPAAINAKGQIAGSSPYPYLGPYGGTFLAGSPTGPGFFYDGAGTFTPIQPSGAISVQPVSLNDRGEILGNYRTTPDGTFTFALDNPFYYANGKASDVNSALANLPAGMYLNTPMYINNSGQMLLRAVSANDPLYLYANDTANKLYVVSPSSTPVLPAIGAVLNGASHLPGVASATWIQIQGQNLSETTRSWTSSDFDGNQLPTSLDGVSVTINGLPAYPSFVSPKELKVLAPDDATAGQVQVQVTNALGVSAPFTLTKTDRMPAIMNNSELAPSNVPGVYINAWAIATHADGTPVCQSIVSGCRGKGAGSGETISIYGTGFGTTKTPTPAGEILAASAELSDTVSLTVDGKPATVTYAGRIGSGLEQINVTLPDSLPQGNLAVVATITGVSTPSYVTIWVSDAYK